MPDATLFETLSAPASEQFIFCRPLKYVPIQPYTLGNVSAAFSPIPAMPITYSSGPSVDPNNRVVSIEGSCTFEHPGDVDEPLQIVGYCLFAGDPPEVLVDFQLFDSPWVLQDINHSVKVMFGARVFRGVGE